MHTQRKRVRFCLEQNQEVEDDGYIQASCSSALWYSSREAMMIKSTAYTVAKESRHTAVARVLGMIYDSNDNVEDAQDKLNLWARHAQLRRGLEAVISKDFRRRRQAHKEFVLEAVLAAQGRLRQMDCDAEERNELIARLCVRQTAQAARFATMMGLADEKAANAPLSSSRSNSMAMCRRRSSAASASSKYPTSLPDSPRTVVNIAGQQSGEQ